MMKWQNHIKIEEGKDEASGYVDDPLCGIGSEFTEVSLLHVSDRNMVWRAKRYGRWWVLKGINPEHPDTTALIALRKEFEIMISLRHPCIADAYAMEDVPRLGKCIVMEDASHLTLAQWLDTNPTRQRRARVAEQFMKAVAYIHARGVVHRDLKPSNIMVAELDEQVKLIDFGLADTMSHTVFKAPAGTQGYMSPEQACDNTPDVRNDIYSAGKVLELLHAGFSWNRVAVSCTRCRERRPRNVDSLMRSRRLWRLLPVAMAAVATVAMMWFFYRPVGKAAESGKAIVVRDSVALPSPEPELVDADGTEDSLRFLLTAANDSLASLRSRTTGKEQRLQQAIDKGKSMVDRSYNATAMHFLDTVSLELLKVFPAYPPTETDRVITRYTETLDGEFTDADVQAIYTSLNLHLSNRISEWNRRREKIISNGSATR